MRRDLTLERAWRERIERFEQSGLTIREFCQREDLVVHQFSWWRRELKRRTADDERSAATRPAQRRKRPQRQDAAAKFVAVQVASTAATKPPIEIVLSRPLRIAVSSGFDPHVLADVIRALEDRPC